MLATKQKEANLQAACVNWFYYQHPMLLLFAIPNGGSRHIVEAANLKKQGVKAGVADLQLLYGTDKYNGLFIELKTGKNKQTDCQKSFEIYRNKHKYKYVVCRSLGEFIKNINDYICDK